MTKDYQIQKVKLKNYNLTINKIILWKLIEAMIALIVNKINKIILLKILIKLEYKYETE
jgi:hypothetical protein